MSARPSVAAIVVTHDSGDLVAGCLASLRANAGDADLRLVVSDSGSREPPRSCCAAAGAVLVEGPNRGFGAAVNRALACPETAGAAWALVANPDTTVVDGTIGMFAARAEARPGCVAAGPRLVDEHGELVHSIGREPTPADYWRAARTTWADWVWDDQAYTAETRADWVAGCFLLVSMASLRAVGGFDERFFLYSEEVDLCTRLRRAGGEVAYLPALTVAHRVAGRPVDPELSRLLVRSKLLYAGIWHGRAGALSMRAALVVLHWRQLRQRRRAGRDGAFERAQLAEALRPRSAAQG